MRENEKLVTIARYENDFDAELFKLALDNEGTPCFLADNDGQPYPTLVTVELQVFERDVPRAMEVFDRREDIDDNLDVEGAGDAE